MQSYQTSSDGSDIQQIMQRMLQLEHQMNYLIKLMEYNNQKLHEIEQMQNKVCTAGSGSVIVRM
ncbi:hypothetical protein ABET51_19255 [Metabacillus fastidiosus]|uniref:hypothetical protein n=1 Tax=Metabacillus fastidiosus TaxID=1458 RepID=UPI003D291C7D